MCLTLATMGFFEGSRMMRESVLETLRRAGVALGVITHRGITLIQRVFEKQY